MNKCPTRLAAHVRSLSGLVVCAILFAFGQSETRAEDILSAEEGIDPPMTKVLLLPPIDATTYAKTLATLHQFHIRLQAQYQLIGRHFAVLNEGAAETAVTQSPRLKIERLEDRSAEVLDALAVRTGTDWVLSIAVHEIVSDNYANAAALRESDLEYSTARCEVTLQLRDARRHLWLANRKYVGRLTGRSAPPDLLTDSVGHTTAEALLTVLWPYPEIVPVSKNGKIVDYLSGATQPVTGVPGKLFTGWKPGYPTGKKVEDQR